MITSAQLDNVGEKVIYTSTGSNAITTIIICNTGTPDLGDETVNSAVLTLNLVANGQGSNAANTIIKNLIVPAGETVFLSEERVVLDNGDSVRATADTAELLSITVSTLPV
jgi:hypothetical protein